MRALALAGLVMGASCTTEATIVVEVGTIGITGGGFVAVELPDSVAPMQPFTVQVITEGGGCVEAERTDVELEPDRALITPYDRRTIPPEGGGCTLILVSLVHEATLVFDTPGEKTIVLRGQQRGRPPGELVDYALPLLVE